MKKYFLLPILALVSFTSYCQPWEVGNFVQATLKNGNNSPNSVFVTIKPSKTLTLSKFSSFQFTVGVPATVSPAPVATVTSLDPAIGYPVPQVSEEMVGDTLFTLYSFSGDGLQSGAGITYDSGSEYNIAEVTFSNIPEVLIDVSIVQIPGGGTNQNNNFYLADHGFDVTNRLAQFYSGTPENVFNDGQGYDGTSYAILKNIALPVKLNNFSAIKNGKDALLNWSVENQDANSDHFEIERSANGTDFIKIGDIHIRRNNEESYSFIDKDIVSLKQNGAVYYRLKMIDKDGKFTYSEIKNIKLSTKGFGVNLYPNPSKNYTNLSIDLDKAYKVKLNICDVGGKQVKQILYDGIKGLNQKKLNVSMLSAGSYIIKVQAGAQVQTVSFIKE